MMMKAHAKINVGLRIGGVRADGFHEIWSILQEIELCDEITLREAPDLLLSVSGGPPDLPADENNLCLKAARLLKAEFKLQRGAHIHLQKKVPMGAGLGGGSSDAAAVLKGLNLLWNLGLEVEELLRLSAQLGSDVPFFVLGGSCVAQGRGERLTPITPLIQDPLLLLTPGIAISTAWAYKNITNYSLTQGWQNINLVDLKKEAFSEILPNDFEPLVFKHHPVLWALKDQLRRAGAYYASLSGSGSSLYGVFHSEENAHRACESIQMEGQKYLLNRREAANSGRRVSASPSGGSDGDH